MVPSVASRTVADARSVFSSSRANSSSISRSVGPWKKTAHQPRQRSARLKTRHTRFRKPVWVHERCARLKVINHFPPNGHLFLLRL
jgi:hypothetical protein